MDPAFGKYYDWLYGFIGLEYWKEHRAQPTPYRPSHNISLYPQTARRTMRSVNRNS